MLCKTFRCSKGEGQSLLLPRDVGGCCTKILCINSYAVLEMIFLYAQNITFFGIFLLIRHSINWTEYNLLTDNTLKKITQDVLVRCSVIMSDHNVKLAGHFQNLVGQCLVTDCYFQHCYGCLL